MKYAMLIYEQPGSLASLGETERGEVLGEYLELASDSRWSQGAQLQPIETATTVQVRDGEARRKNGPFADSGEPLGGIMVFEVTDLDEALDLAARIPAARLGGHVEVRPVVERPS